MLISVRHLPLLLILLTLVRSEDRGGLSVAPGFDELKSESQQEECNRDESLSESEFSSSPPPAALHGVLLVDTITTGTTMRSNVEILLGPWIPDWNERMNEMNHHREALWRRDDSIRFDQDSTTMKGTMVTWY